MPSRVRGKDVERASPLPCTRNFAVPVLLDGLPLPSQRLLCSGLPPVVAGGQLTRADAKQSLGLATTTGASGGFEVLLP